MCEIKVNVECAGKEMKQKTIDKKKKLCGLTVEFAFAIVYKGINLRTYTVE